jgi:hypothetical protein
MGGFGSGAWCDVLNRKKSIEQCRILSSKQLRLAGLFSGVDNLRVGWRNASGRVLGEALIINNGGRLTIKDGGLEYTVTLEQTACWFGGWRWWFLCPLSKNGIYCGNRCSKLYLPHGREFFGCRECYDLTYLSCQESHKYDRVFGHIEGADIGSLSVTQALRLGGL